ncbi:hypothetical protein GCM10010421_14460 [Streptomyces glaucus]|uniref:Uncharacterized protein n=1 Tax=Streptomyces glaucus TaxID=284029 RepID=A0ABP5WLJ7_9ACTN
MLMLQPPGRGSTYRYVLPPVLERKRRVRVIPPIRRMCRRRAGCMRDGWYQTVQTVTFRS